jgi:phosphoribosylglycinamide formyltransferase-1
MNQRRKVAILISGRGSNMAALIQAAAERDYPAEIAVVISDNADAPGLKLATSRGIASGVVERKGFVSKTDHDEAVDKAIRSFDAEFVALAGYMRLLSRPFVEKWRGRMINIHPSLLPLFRGLEPHKQALAAGVRVHGASVHFVTPETDAGPIIAQAAVPVLVGDSENDLAARVLKAEHQLYPQALKLLVEGKVRIEDDHSIFAPFSDQSAGLVIAPSPVDDVLDLEHLARITP